MALEQRTVGVVLLGLAFMLLFTAFQTQGNMQEVVIDSIIKDDPSFTGSGYISLSIVYAVSAPLNWVAPSVLTVLGPKLTMFLGATTYTLFVASFLWPQTWLLYLASAIVGVGAALIWVGQGNYLSLLSDDTTVRRNSGIFWAMFQCSLVFGNLFVYYQFRGEDVIDEHTRTVVFSVLTAVSVLGLVVFVILPRPHLGAGRAEDGGTPMQAFVNSVQLFKTREMLLLCITFFYAGLELSFYSGVYSSCLSFTLRFPDPKELVGLSGIFIGLGEISGGAIFGIFGHKTIKFGRDPIVLLGYIVHVVAFYLVFLNIPAAAPLGDTHDTSYFADGQPREVLAMFCSFLLGFGDACFNTQIYSLLGSVYSDNSGPAFAVFKFFQCLSASLSFVCSSIISLHWHLAILIVFATAATISFCLVEWKAQRKHIS